jgi:hypothetical protein
MNTSTTTVLIPFCLIFFLLNPLYVFIPLLIIRREVRINKKYQIQALRDEKKKIVDSPHNAARLDRIERKIEKIAAIPDMLFSPRRIIIIIFTYFIPVLSFFCKIIIRK